MTSAFDWKEQAGRSWSQDYARTDRSFAQLTCGLLERLVDAPGQAVLDIGCGAGELSLALACSRRTARVVGLDISDDLVAVANARAQAAALGGATPEFVVGDASNWASLGFVPDLLVSRHGVMFFDDPIGAFAHLREIAAPEANLAFSCFRAPQLNPWASELAALLPKECNVPSDPVAPGPFAFADRSRVEDILYRAGWKDIYLEPLDFTYVAGSGTDPVGDAAEFFGRIGVAARAMREMPEPALRDFCERMRTWLEANHHGDEVRFGAAAWLVTATRS